jgi:tight adherence protein C
MIMLGMGIVVLILWLVIYFLSRRYDVLFENLSEDEFKFKDIFSMGYWFMEKIKYPYRSKRDRRMRQELEILYEPKYVDYYLRVVYAQAVSYAMTLIVASFIIYALSGELAAFVIMIGFAALSIYYALTLADDKIKKRSEELLGDFSEVVSKLALLTNAGMILKEAWELVAQQGEGIIYDEMRIAVDEMDNGISEKEAIRRFGIRCMIPEIKKFATTLIQGIEKGNRELSSALLAQSSEAWNLRQQEVRRMGEKANSKLMIPIFMMFIGIIIMVVVPIFANIGSV